jgi:hypothetical protein
MEAIVNRHNQFWYFLVKLMVKLDHSFDDSVGEVAETAIVKFFLIFAIEQHWSIDNFDGLLQHVGRGRWNEEDNLI